MGVTIGRCSVADIDDVVRFIDEHWQRGHIFTTSRSLLDWQHRDENGYAFVIARRTEDRAVLGVLGFIATSRFDPALANDNVVWLTTWKVREDAAVAGLGLQLLQYLSRVIPHRAVGAIFPAATTMPIYRAMKFQVGEVEHYIRVKGDRKSTAAGRPPDWRHVWTDADFGELVWTDATDRSPRKTPEYFRRRYAHHPLYAYTIVALFDAGALCGMLAARTAEHAGIRALRIVDFFGPSDVLARSGPVVQSLIDEERAAYADIYNAGISQDALAGAGFRRIDPEGAEIVPDNFEPFEARNVRLWFAFKGSDHPILFKGDSDRDRPNRVPATA